ncbi:uncharacterized protein N7458_005822 [Penicillium daleae]|uniref:Uncharacterized protein n=1 Tax=Penicillium daleae TaxID=63821 RepID=A0AAD6C9J8_9EURO|nr:uncharacterized protein N7458_005822 [Penicillium daleae]KAJ5454866.1 hypothetical protein N7458_005822 [Penicillium daleae]
MFPRLLASQSNTFNLIAIHSGSGVQYASFNAAKSSIFAGPASQHASCARPEEQLATFYHNDEALYLYDQSATPQELYVDRSEMDWIYQYTTGAQPAPKNADRDGWKIKDGHLQFAGNVLIACPNSIDNSWSIWVSAGVSNLGGNTDCVGIAVRVVETSNSSGCLYTE